MAETPTRVEQSRKRQALLMLGTAVIMIPAGFWLFSRTSADQQQANVALAPSEQTFQEPRAPAQVEPASLAKVLISRRAIESAPITARTEQLNADFVISVSDANARIDEISMPFGSQYGFRIDGNCLAQGPRTLSPGEACTVQLTYDPIRAGRLSGTITIRGIAYRTNGESQPFVEYVQVNLEAVEPTAVAPVAPQPVIQEDTSLRDDFLRRRSQQGLLQAQQNDAALTYLGPQRPSQDSWASIGFKPNMSTYPVDLSRTVTMDKPIPAVIKIPIDTRNPSRAVATVERDIYGGDGRLVVIERGSTLIGTVASNGNVGEEKVGISWQRIVRPDGAAFAIEASSGDAMGRSGVAAHIDNRWIDRFGKTILFSVLQGGITAASGGTTTSSDSFGGTTQRQDARAVGVQTANETLTPLLQEYMREQLALPPIRSIPVGTRITVFPSTDIVLRPIVPTSEMQQDYAAEVRRSPAYQDAMRGADNALRDMQQYQRDAARQNPAYAQPGLVTTPNTRVTLPDAVPGANLRPAYTSPAEASRGFLGGPTANEQMRQRANTAIPSAAPSPIRPRAIYE